MNLLLFFFYHIPDGSDSPYLKSLVSCALQFCDRSAPSRLLPANSWLRLPLPPQVASMTAPGDVAHLVATPDSQTVLLCSAGAKEVDMFHLPSKNFVRSFQGEWLFATKVRENFQ